MCLRAGQNVMHTSIISLQVHLAMPGSCSHLHVSAPLVQAYSSRTTNNSETPWVPRPWSKKLAFFLNRTRVGAGVTAKLASRLPRHQGLSYYDPLRDRPASVRSWRVCSTILYSTHVRSSLPFPLLLWEKVRPVDRP